MSFIFPPEERETWRRKELRKEIWDKGKNVINKFEIVRWTLLSMLAAWFIPLSVDCCDVHKKKEKCRMSHLQWNIDLKLDLKIKLDFLHFI